jgi:hypothetical protein
MMSRPPFCTLAWAPVALVSCGPNTETTTQCVYSAKQIGDLEISAAAYDRNALRELELCYDFDGKAADRERIHLKRLELGEPEAMTEEAERLMNLAGKAKSCDEKRAILLKSLRVALNAARPQRLSEPTQSSTVRLVDSELARLQCK